MTEALQGWQTVASAPSDGRQVWALGGRYDKPTLTEADGGWWRNVRRTGSRVAPTQWAPLIAPPLPPPTPLACLQSASACLAAAQSLIERAEALAVRQCADNAELAEFRRRTDTAWTTISEDAESAIQAAMAAEIEMADAGEVSAAEHAAQERRALMAGVI